MNCTRVLPLIACTPALMHLLTGMDHCSATRERQVILNARHFCAAALEMATRDAHAQSGMLLRVIHYFDNHEKSDYYGGRPHADPDPAANWYIQLVMALKDGDEPFTPIGELISLGDNAVFRCKDKSGVHIVSLRGNNPLRLIVKDTTLELLHLRVNQSGRGVEVYAFARVAAPPTLALAKLGADALAARVSCPTSLTLRNDYWFPSSDNFPRLYPFAPLPPLPSLELLRKRPEAEAWSDLEYPQR